jgi:ABC-type sugar transport system substrate-binding protein
MGDDYFKSHVAGTRQCAHALGLSYEGFVNENKPERQLSQFEIAGGKGARMITVIPPDNSNVPAVFKRANEYNVYTVLSAEMPPWYFPYMEGPYSVSFITPFDYKSFYDVTKFLFDKINGKGKVLMITGFPGGTPDTLRTAAAMKAISEYPQIELLGSLAGRWNRVDGRKAMEDLMTANPDFDAVICLNDEMAIGAISALDDADKKNIPIIGHNGTTDVMEFIKNGRILATASTFPFWTGAYMVAMAYDAAHGYELSLPERMLIAQHAVVTHSNVDLYIQKFVKKIDKLPFDFKKMSKVLHPDDWDPQNLVYPLDVHEYFRFNKKPKGFEMPPQWQNSIDSGKPEKIAKIYEEHYKNKIL